MNYPSRLAALALSFAMGILASSVSQAQQFPTKPIRLLVPFAAGATTDLMARALGQKLSDILGQPVIIDNRPGSDTIIAADILARSPADGHTLNLTLDVAFTVNPHLYSKLPYDPVRDFAPVSLVGTTALLMVANMKLPANNAQELVAYAKANPGKLNYGSGAASTQIAVELLKQSTGIDMVFIPFKGAAPALQALLSGDIDLAIAGFASFLPAIKQGKIKPLFVTGTARDASLPDVPTVVESGYPNVVVNNWFAVYAPAKTPPAIVDKLSRDIARVIAMPDFAERMRNIGVAPLASTPAELAARQKADSEKLGRVIKAAGIKVD
ncbi:MAG: hypothetical protein A3G80_01695 [Betaproteobacteria bacterium RIFCSPLOWO2_12_FULL_62_13b]|nr:MAG: hypothetical protein A3G80_01695 [Betaproteobacteria bacterium RIFCSPLOWO2_12_FULL_62_13b]